jgi:beta-xylosidase
VHAHTVRLEGPVRVVDHTRRLHPLVDVHLVPAEAPTTG